MKKTVVFCLLIICCTQLAAQQRKPNVLLIHTDDHRFSGIGINSKQQVKTPNIDALAQTGINLTNAYMMGAFSGATCVPSRAMLLTGRNLFELEGAGHTIPPEHTMMGEAFMQAGYHAYHVGKWHQDFQSLARSANDGAKVAGKPAYLTDQYRMPYHDWEPTGKYSRKNCYLLAYDNDGNVASRPLTSSDKRGPTGTEKTGPHVSAVLASEAVSFIENYNEEKPFFMYLAFPTPHDPRQAPKAFKDLYPENEITLTPSYMPQHPFDNGHMVIRDEKLASWPRTPEIAKKHLSDYYAIISHLDTQIGKVVAALKAHGQYENTILVFVGDSGLAVGNHGLLGKQNIYNEDGVHIPLIISGGAIAKDKRGSEQDSFCYNFDVFPTLCELAGIEPPSSITGKSLTKVLFGAQKQFRETMFFAYRQHQRAFRKGAYKLIEYVRAPDTDRKLGDIVSGSRVTQLFNIENDPWEAFNLADFPEYKSIVSELRNEMKSAAQALGDTADGKRTAVDFWKYYQN